MEQLTTATGKTLDCGFLAILLSPEWVYIRVYNVDMQTAAEIFGDPAETARLTFGDQVVEGYTVLKNLLRERDCIRITLEKE